jgi:hypothetical protein
LAGFGTGEGTSDAFHGYGKGILSFLEYEEAQRHRSRNQFLLALSAENFPSREPIHFDYCSGGMSRDAGDGLRPGLIEIFIKSFGLKVSTYFFK